MKFSYEIILSIITSLALSIIVSFFANNIVISASIFTATLVTIQFLLNRYENRIDVIIEMGIAKDDDENEFFSSIKNNGGKTLYLKSGGIMTKEGNIVDFDDEIKEPDTNDFTGLARLIVLPNHIGRYFFPHTLNPGQSRRIYKSIIDVLRLLNQSGWNFKSELEIKGFFKDQLDRIYETSQYEKYNVEEIFELAKRKN